MHKTEQAGTARYMSRLDKPLEQTTINTGRRNNKPQYLDVALAQISSREAAKAEKTLKNNGNKQGKDTNNGFKKIGSTNTLSGKNVAGSNNKGGSTERKYPARGVVKPNQVTSTKGQKDNKPEKEKFQTFKEKEAFQNQQNQKLYQELDQMLTGGRGINQVDSKYPAKSTKDPSLSKTVKKDRKKDSVFHVTKDNLFPSISSESKNKIPGLYGSYQRDPVPPLQKNNTLGQESATWHSRELKAKERLQTIERIEDFRFKDTKPKGALDEGPAGKYLSNNSYMSVGVPVHTESTSSRRHIVADIPVYVPNFSAKSVNAPPLVTENQTTGRQLDTVFETTVPGVELRADKTGKPAHAPEAFTAPLPQFEKKNSPDENLNNYSVNGNPVSERLLFEKKERERAKLEQETLKYFDVENTDPVFEKVSHPLLKSHDQFANLRKEETETRTLISDPGPKRRGPILEDLEQYKYSPYGYLAEKEKKLQTERERQPNNTGYYDQKVRSDLRKQTAVDREDSWIKQQLESPDVMASNRGGETYRADTRPERRYEPPRIGSFDRDQHNRQRSLNDDRYSDRGRDSIRGSMESLSHQNQYSHRPRYEDEPQYTPKFDRERREQRLNSDRRDDQGRIYVERGRYERDSQYDRNQDQRFSYNGDRAKYGKENENRRDRDYDTRVKYSGDRSRNLDEMDRRSDKDYDNDRNYNMDNRRNSRDHESRWKYGRDGDRRSDDGTHDKHRQSYREIEQQSDRERNRLRDYESDQRYERDERARRYNEDNKYDREREGNRDKRDDRYDSERNKSRNYDVASKPPLRDTSKQSIGSDSGKVQYVLRKRSSGSKSDMRKSRMSQHSEPLPENVPPPSTELPSRSGSVKSEHVEKQVPVDDRKSSQAGARQTPIGSEHLSKPVSESKEAASAAPTYETAVSKKADRGMDDYFDEPARPDDPADKIPFYSDNTSKYSRSKSDFRNKDPMTPVQELSIKQSEEDEMTDKDSSNKSKLSHDSPDTEAMKAHPDGDKKDEDGERKVLVDPYERLDKKEKVFPPTSIRNKHHVEEGRRSPWRKEDKVSRNVVSPVAGKESYPEGPELNKDVMDPNKGADSVAQLKERLREKTLERMRIQSRQKTVDSQGPTQDEKDDEPEDTGRLNMDELETEMDERELYVCYLQTDAGDIIGPLKLDLDDVQIGLPKPLDKTDMKQDQEIEDEEGMRNRQTGSHGLNEFSSRSHSMLMLTIDSEQQDPEDENLYITKRGKLTFVDLAGSEKVKDSNSTADSLVESNSINKSLLVLGNCISSLGDSKRRQGHIPYRDSKLTKLLADSLGGNGVTLMICCITPSSNHASETMNTLRYASRAKKIRTKPVVKIDPREKLILSLKREIKVLRNENHYLRQQLDFPAKPKGQLQKENDQKFMKMVKETNEKLKQNGAAADESGLYEMLQEYMVENEALRTENAEMQVTKDRFKQEQQILYRDNERLMRRVEDLERRMNQAQASWQSMPRQSSQEVVRSRDHSPRGSPQYARAGGSGGKPAGRPPGDLPLRDPVYPGSPPQGYTSPTGSNKGKQPPQGRGQPMKPPHRLAEPIGQQRPVYEQNAPYMNGHQAGYPGMAPGGPPTQYRQAHIGSPNRANDFRMDSRRSSQSSSSENKAVSAEKNTKQDAIRDMNERLKHELMQLDGEIHHHTAVNNRSVYGSQGSMR